MKLNTRMLYSKMSKTYLSSPSPYTIYRRKTIEKMGPLFVFSNIQGKGVRGSFVHLLSNNLNFERKS